MKAEVQQRGFVVFWLFFPCVTLHMLSEKLQEIRYEFLQQVSYGHNDKILLPWYEGWERPIEVTTWEERRKKEEYISEITIFIYP